MHSHITINAEFYPDEKKYNFMGNLLSISITKYDLFSHENRPGQGPNLEEKRSAGPALDTDCEGGVAPSFAD